MEKLTLQPHVWTRLFGTTFQVIGQVDVKFTLGTEDAINNAGAPVKIPTDNAPYFTTQGYNPKVISLRDWNPDIYFGYFYLMPVGDSAVSVVSL